MTACGLANNGTIDLTGGTAVQTTLNIAAAAPATWTGTANLTGDALMEFASGGITAIGSGAQPSLNGARSRVALSSALSSNSALTGLAANAGTFSLDGGAVLATTVAFSNAGTLRVDDNFGPGGSSLTIGGASRLVATLTGEPAINAATELFFIS